MLNVLITIGRFLLPYTQTIFELLTSIQWTWQKIITIIEIIAILGFGIYSYEKGENSCQAKVEKSKNEKTIIKNNIRNMPIDMQSGINILHSHKW